METELRRLSTFVKWPQSAPVCSMTLARIGFYYTGERDEVTCWACNIQLHNWSTNDNPLEKHKQMSPRCPLTIVTEKENNLLHVTSSTNQSTTTDHSQVDNNKIGDAQRKEPVISVLKEANDNVNSMKVSLLLDEGKLLSETIRLSTFREWPQKAKVIPRILAREGFFYRGQEDRVQCVFCRGCMRDWESTDVPLVKHKKLFPQCPFVLGVDVGNIPLDRDTTSQCFNGNNNAVIQNLACNIVSSEPKYAPKYPEYADMRRRIESFEYGTVATGQIAEVLAEAGFFFIGPGDKVKCFHCGGNLHQWEPEDEPHQEHRRWYPYCDYANALHSNSMQPIITASEPREIIPRLDTPSVRVVLSMGYSEDLVRRVIQTKLSTAGDDFQSAESLLEAIFAVQEETVRARDDSESEKFTISNPHMSGSDVHLLKPTISEHSTFASTGSNSSSSNAIYDFSNQRPVSPTTSTLEVGTETEKLSETSESRTVLTNSEDETIEEFVGNENLQYEDENRRLRDARTCKVCMESEVNTVFLPCGHLVCCSRCSPSLQNCPICRSYIKGTVRTYLS